MGLWALSMPTPARAESPACTRSDAPVVVLSASQLPAPTWLSEVARHLTAGLASSGVAVCAASSGAGKPIAEVELTESEEADSALRIQLHDALTHKTLQRALDLASIPPDSRSLAMALYVEELLEASWAEIALQKRVYLQEHAVKAPPEVRRQVDMVLPAPEAVEARARRLRLSVGGSVAGSQGGLLLLGPDVIFGVAPLAWLELSVRGGYRASPRVEAQHGAIRADALLGGLSLEPRWRASRLLSLCWPQGMDVMHVRFTGLANDSGRADSGSRIALVIWHAAGLRVAFDPSVSITALARFAWTLLSAQAADDERTVMGVAGVGGEGSLSVDMHF